MSNGFLPDSDAALQTWLTTFLNVANANLAILGLTPGDLAALAGEQGTFSSQLVMVDTDKKALKAAVTSKELTHKLIAANARALAKRIQGNAAITPALKAQLGLNPRNNKPGVITPVAPSGLMATGADTGTNTLKWKPNGNKPGVVYLVEAQIGNGAFIQVGAPTAAKFTHTGQVPGVEITYRIRARRREVVSDPSNTATLYKTGAMTEAQGTVLELKKAA